MSVRDHAASLPLFPINCECGQEVGSSGSTSSGSQEVGKSGSQERRNLPVYRMQMRPWIFESSVVDRFSVAQGSCSRKFHISSCAF